MDITVINTDLKKFELTDTAIKAIAEKYLPLSISGLDDKEGKKAVHAARIDVKNRRVSVEKTRKALKEDALKYGKAVDEEARRITALLDPIETHLKEEEDRIKNLKAEIERAKKEEEEAKERARLQAIEDEIRAKLDAEREEMERQRREEEERQAAIQAEQEARQAKLEALARKLDEQQSVIRDEQLKIEKEKLALEKQKQPPTVETEVPVGDIIDCEFEYAQEEPILVIDDIEDKENLAKVADQLDRVNVPLIRNERLAKTAKYVIQALQELSSIIREVIDDSTDIYDAE